jgi:hypothetical protein
VRQLNDRAFLSPSAVAVGVVVAVVFGLVAHALGVNPVAAVAGVIVATGLELFASPARSGGRAVPAMAARSGQLSPTGPSPAPSMPVAPPMAEPSAPPPPLLVPSAPEPAAEVPCPSCGLYPVPPPDPIALPEAGTYRQLGPA